MARLFKWFIITLTILLVLALLLVAGAWLIARQTVTEPSGTLVVPGLSATVSVVRDVNAVAHIEAENREDAAFALGLTHAQERLWQMESLRMTAQGRLSELYGVNSDVQAIDVFLRTLGFAAQAKSSLEVLDEETRSIVEAYSRGVNTHLDQPTGVLRTNLPPEFIVLGHTPEPWKATDSLLILKLMSLQLSKNMGHEIIRMGLAAQGLSPDEIGDILPAHPDENQTPLPDLRQLLRLKAPTKSAELPSGFQQAFEERIGITASNNWVLAEDRTTTGGPLLANDPHLDMTAPTLWYLAHLRWVGEDGGARNMFGATIPGVPTVILGQNDHIAWGFTNAGADVQDLFVEQINPDNGNQYKTPAGWAEFDRREEIITIKGSEPLKVVVRTTRHGPVLPRKYRSYGDFLPDDHVLALKWTGLSPADASLSLLNSIVLATSVEEFGAIVSKTISPMQAMVVADTKGSIGLFAKAAVPLRSSRNLVKGRAPVPGWDGTYDWLGIMGPVLLPEVIDPANGAIGTANSRFMEKSYSEFLTYDWDEPWRHDRVQLTIVNANKKLGIDDMKAAQLDIHSDPMLAFRDELVAALEQSTAHPSVLRMIQQWDGKMSSNSGAPLVLYETFRMALLEVFEDDLGPVIGSVSRQPSRALLGVLKRGGARDWCDKRGTPRIESCAEVLEAAFEKSVSHLREKAGSDPARWRWGALHTHYNEHRPFSRVWPLSMIFTIEQPAPGGPYTLMRAKPILFGTNPYRTAHGAGYRAIYDVKNPSNSVFVSSTGQSGNPFSRHYRDLADDWVNGRYLPSLFEQEKYREGAQGIWELKPAD